jgi:hypothetical protein
MVPNLPYFMVQFDHKGERGYGHVIEGVDNAEGDDAMEEGEKGGGEFPRFVAQYQNDAWANIGGSYFAGEIIGNVLDLEARQWRRPKRIDFRSNKERVVDYKKKYEKFDWTGMIGREA